MYDPYPHRECAATSLDPLWLSFELWGHLNLRLQGEEKIAFNDVEPGNGFDAWRRVVVLIGILQ